MGVGRLGGAFETNLRIGQRGSAIAAPPSALRLARILLDLSDEVPDFSPDAEAAWEQEICRRMEEVKAGRAGSSEFNDVFERLELTDGICRIEDVATGRVPGLTEEEYRAGLSC